jgi:hypothetical protein
MKALKKDNCSSYNGNYLTSIIDCDTGQNLIYNMQYNTGSQLTAYATNQGRPFFQDFNTYGYPTATSIGFSSSNHNKEVTIAYDINPVTLNMNNRKKFYDYDGSRNLQFTETFTYDPLDRLTQWQVTNNTTNTTNTYTVNFANNGNITQKSDMGIYAYSSDKPNAVINVSNLEGESHTVTDNLIQYTLFNKTASMQRVNGVDPVSTYDITYGPDDQRRKSHYYTAAGYSTTTIYSGLFEERSNGERLYHISTPAGIAALVVTNKNNTTQRDIYYLYNDYQGSLIGVQKKGTTSLEQFSYDPWGRRRTGTNWLTYGFTGRSFADFYKRGYTGHVQ